MRVADKSSKDQLKSSNNTATANIGEENNVDNTSRDLLDKKTGLNKPKLNLNYDDEGEKKEDKPKLNNSQGNLQQEDSLIVESQNDEKVEEDFKKRMDKIGQSEDNNDRLEEFLDKKNNFDNRSLRTNKTNQVNNDVILDEEKNEYNGEIDFTQDENNNKRYLSESQVEPQESFYSNPKAKIMDEAYVKEKEEMNQENEILKEQIRKLKEEKKK